MHDQKTHRDARPRKHALLPTGCLATLVALYAVAILAVLVALGAGIWWVRHQDQVETEKSIREMHRAVARLSRPRSPSIPPRLSDRLAPPPQSGW
jgi:hypothetical protein